MRHHLSPVPTRNRPVLEDSFDSYGQGQVITDDTTYSFGTFPAAGTSGSGNPSGKWEADTGGFYGDHGWGYSGRPIDTADKYFFRVNSRNHSVRQQQVSFTYKSAPFGQDGFTVDVPDATDIWLRYQSQYNLYALQFDRTDNEIVCKRKVPAQGWTGNPAIVSNKGVYYTLLTDASSPTGAGTGYGLTWTDLSSFLAGESGKPSYPNLAHDGTSTTGTTYDFTATCVTLAGGEVQIRLWRGGVLCASWIDLNDGVNDDGDTLAHDVTAGYFTSVTGYDSSWYDPITLAGAVGWRADNIKCWFDNFVLRDIYVPVTGLTAYDSMVLADLPVAYYALDGTATTDLTAGGHDLTYVGSPTATTLPNGDSACVFDGSTQYAEIADADVFSIPTTGVLAIEALIRPDVLEFPHQESTGYVHFAGKGGPTTGGDGHHEWTCRIYSYTNTESPPRPNRISGYAYNHAGGLGVGAYWQDAISAGDWVHFGLIINVPYDSVSIYKNGIHRNTQYLSSLGITPTNDNKPVRIGTRDLQSFFQGAVGKFAIYDYAIPADRFAAHAATALLITVPPTASFTLTPDTGSAPLTVAADASASIGISHAISTYTFDWGDSTTTGPQAGATAGHTYTVGGVYTVTVTVTDTIAATGTTTLTATATATNNAAFVQQIDTAKNSAQVSGTTLVFTVPGGGIPIGHTLFIRSASDGTGGAPNVADSRANTYTRDRSAAFAGSTFRVNLHRCPVTTALLAGDTITITWGTACVNRAAVCDEFSGLITSSPIDVQNGNSGTSSTPGSGAILNTTNAYDLLFSYLGAQAPVTDSYTQDAAWTNLGRAGTSAGSAPYIEIGGGFRTVTATGTYTCQPVLGASVPWITGILGYKST